MSIRQTWHCAACAAEPLLMPLAFEGSARRGAHALAARHPASGTRIRFHSSPYCFLNPCGRYLPVGTFGAWALWPGLCSAPRPCTAVRTAFPSPGTHALPDLPGSAIPSAHPEGQTCPAEQGGVTAAASREDETLTVRSPHTGTLLPEGSRASCPVHVEAFASTAVWPCK